MLSPSLVSAWRPLWDALQHEGRPILQLQPVKVRAHMLRAPAGTVQAPHLTFGNSLADAFASWGAASLTLALGHLVSEVSLIDAKATLVMRRLAAICLEDAAANPRAKKGRPKGRPRGPTPEPGSEQPLGGPPLAAPATETVNGHELDSDMGLGWLLDSEDEAQAGQHMGEDDSAAFFALFCSHEAPWGGGVGTGVGTGADQR